jgi:hypothetical protein
MCVGGGRSKYTSEMEDQSECWGRRSLVDCWVILKAHLPCLSPGMSEEIRFNNSTAKKMLKRFT